MGDAPAAVFEQEAEGLVSAPARRPALSGRRGSQVGVGQGGHGDGPHLEGLPGAQRFQPQRKRRRGEVEQMRDPQQRLHRLHARLRQVQGERALPPRQPHPLKQGEHPAHVVKVQVGNDHAVERLQPRARAQQRLGGRLAAVHQQAGGAKFVEERRVRPAGRSMPVPHSQTGQAVLAMPGHGRENGFSGPIPPGAQMIVPCGTMAFLGMITMPSRM